MRSAHAPVLVVFGEFFLELVFYELDQAPRPGTEVRSRDFARTPGGGLATTALVAARLGTRTAAVTRVGRDAAGEDAWEILARSGIDTSCCEVRKQALTAVTVTAAYRGDRLMITADSINRDLACLFERRAVERVLRQARHVHLACALDDPP